MKTIPEKLLSEGYINIFHGAWDKGTNVVDNINGTIVQWLYFYNPEKNVVSTVHEIVEMKNNKQNISYKLHQKDVHPFIAQGLIIKTENVGEYVFIEGWSEVGYCMLEERLKFLGVNWKRYELEKKPGVSNEFLVIDKSDLPVFIFYFNDTIRELPLI
jgi:hypothetical protein